MLLNPNPCCENPCLCCKLKEGGGSSLEDAIFTFTVAGLPETITYYLDSLGGVYIGRTYDDVMAYFAENSGLVYFVEIEITLNLNDDYLSDPGDYSPCLTYGELPNRCRTEGITTKQGVMPHSVLRTYMMDLDSEEQEWELVTTLEEDGYITFGFFSLWYDPETEQRGITWSLGMSTLGPLQLQFTASTTEDDVEEPYTCNELSEVELTEISDWEVLPIELEIEHDELAVTVSSAGEE